jgi:hypothetical protein
MSLLAAMHCSVHLEAHWRSKWIKCQWRRSGMNQKASTSLSCKYIYPPSTTPLPHTAARAPYLASDAKPPSSTCKASSGPPVWTIFPASMM